MQRRIIPYNRSLTEVARKLRSDPTPSEARLWRYLKGGQIFGYDFHRQKPLGNYIVDFICTDLNLVVEIDGSSHNQKIDADRHRDLWLESAGLTVLRFQDRDVTTNIQGVVDAIVAWVMENR